MSDLTRRNFLSAAAGSALAPAGLGAALFAAPVALPQQGPPARLAVMGLNGRGRQLISAFLQQPGVEIAYLCDPDQETVPAALKAVEAAGVQSTPPAVESDFRKALDDPGVTALVCAAPDHWHALATVLACHAGKDVYVEKPCCHNPGEGRKMVEAARRFDRVVQVGTQRRSAEDMRALCEAVQGGKIGRVPFIRAWITSTRPQIGRQQVAPPPKNLDFELWCGPAPNNGYKKNLVHYHWHWRWDYGTGECGNNGIHALDVARWAAGVAAPQLVTCGGGKYFFDDDQETPDTQLATFDYPGLCIQWEHRTWSSRGIDGESYGVAFYGTEGTLVTHGTGYTIYGPKNEVLEKRAGADAQAAHSRNFLECLRTRGRPNADIEVSHQSTLLCHLANIAWRTRSVLAFDPQREQILGNAQAQALMSRPCRKGFEFPA
jgi:predicted dehydrogenase